jgi:hypothetical protein
MIPRPQATDREALATALNSADHNARLAWLRSLSGKEEAALYDQCSGATLTVEEMHRGSGDVVIHEGWNSLLAFRSFQKRVTVFEENVQGYNHQAMRWLTGPGHFRIRDSEDVPGEVWFDYIWEAKTAPDDFPAPQSNTAGISTLVYGHMIDIVRKVSDHVVIGRAIKKGKETPNYFGLVRTDA